MFTFFQTALIEGPDVPKFLSNYTTQSYNILENMNSRRAAVLNREGRVVGIIEVEQVSQSSATIIYPESYREILQSHWALFARLSRVRISWDIHRFERKLEIDRLSCPWLIHPQHSELWTPFDLSCDHMGMIDFQKGCYLGQEIIARIWAKNVNFKKRLGIWTGSFDKIQDSCLYSDCQGNFLAVLAKDLWTNDCTQILFCSAQHPGTIQ